MQTGDRVIYSKFAGTDITINDEAHVLLKVCRVGVFAICVSRKLR